MYISRLKVLLRGRPGGAGGPPDLKSGSYRDCLIEDITAKNGHSQAHSLPLSFECYDLDLQAVGLFALERLL